MTGAPDPILTESYEPYFRQAWLEGLLNQQIESVQIEEKSLFAAGKSRLWHYQILTTEGKPLELYGKFVNSDSAKRQAGLLNSFSSASINCPKALFASPDDHFLIYQAVTGESLLVNFDQIPTKVIADQIINLISNIQGCDTAVKYLNVIKLDQHQNQLEKTRGVMGKLLPTETSKLGRAYQFAHDNLELLSGLTPTHGDLNPWNIILNKDVLGLIDFSESCLAAPTVDIGFLMSSLDFLAVTDQSKSQKALLLRDQLMDRFAKQDLDRSAFQVSYNLATMTHLWVISAYGLEIQKGQQLAKDFLNLSMIE